jgi:hypothetical protein
MWNTLIQLAEAGQPSKFSKKCSSLYDGQQAIDS